MAKAQKISVSVLSTISAITHTHIKKEIILPDTFSQYNFLKSSNTYITLTFWPDTNTCQQNCPQALGVKEINLDTETGPGIVFTAVLLYMFVMIVMLM